MAGVVLPFISPNERSARDNLELFVDHAKYYHCTSATSTKIDWDDATWDLSDFFTSRNRKRKHVARFYNYSGKSHGVNLAELGPLPQPFSDQAKAIFIEYIRTNNVNNFTHIVSVLRIVAKAFENLGSPPDIYDLTPQVLDEAINIIFDTYKTKDSHVWCLDKIVREIINTARITRNYVIWKAPSARDHENENRRYLACNVLDGISDKLPHIKCILDLAGVFNSSSDDVDVVVSSWFALALFSPTRAIEILTLPLKCMTSMDDTFGISWRPAKGGMPLTKFSTSDEWTDVAEEAIRRLEVLGHSSRQAAKWYEENPNELYLPPGLERLRGKPLTKWEISLILGNPNERVPGYLLNHLTSTREFTDDESRFGKIDVRRKKKSRVMYTFDSLEKEVISRLLKDFGPADPSQDLRASEALFCLPYNICHGRGDTLRHVPSLISYNQIRLELGGKVLGKTIFDRHNLLDPRTGKSWRLSTHQPRHLLNTLAQSKHVSQELIAFWSGRKSVAQNAWYDHIPQEVFIETFVAMGADDAPRPIKVIGPLDAKATQRAHKESISYDDAMRLELGSIINTRYGLCRHNYALTPCPKDKDCIGCGENTFIKGDQRHLDEARRQLEVSRRAVENCRRAIEEGEPGVEGWLAKHLEKEERWAMAVEKLTDDGIVKGTLITLSPPKISQTRAGLAAEIRKVEMPVGVLDDMGFDDFDVEGM